MPALSWPLRVEYKQRFSYKLSDRFKLESVLESSLAKGVAFKMDDNVIKVAPATISGKLREQVKVDDMPDISDMFQLRASLLDDEQWRDMCKYRSVGGYWMEFFCSLLPYECYNSTTLRWMGYWFFGYILPVAFLLRAVGNMSPEVWRQGEIFLRHFSLDPIIIFIRWMFGSISFSFFEFPEIFSWVYGYVWLFTSWVAAFDERFTYLISRSQSFQKLATQIWLVFSSFFNIIKSICVLVFSLVAKVGELELSNKLDKLRVTYQNTK